MTETPIAHIDLDCAWPPGLGPHTLYAAVAEQMCRALGPAQHADWMGVDADTGEALHRVPVVRYRLDDTRRGWARPRLHIVGEHAHQHAHALMVHLRALRLPLETIDVSPVVQLDRAQAFTEAHPDRVAVVVHSNGHVVEMHGVAENWPPAPDRENGMQAKMAEWMSHTTLAGALVFGDWHAGDIYEQLAQRAPLVWLDSYASTHGPAPASRHLRAPWTAPKLPVLWRQGVSTTRAATEAIRLVAGD